MWSSDKKVGHYDTILSSSVEIIGDIKVTGGLHIDGVVKGNIVADDSGSAMVRISEKGRVDGSISVPRIIVNGEVIGDVHASQHIELAQKAAITGNVYYTMMEMVLGARVNGNLIHSPEQKGKKKLFGGNEAIQSVMASPELESKMVSDKS